MSDNCNGSVSICALRVAQLTEAGAPHNGSFGYYTDSPLTVKAGPTTDTQNEQIQRNGCGTIVNAVPEVTTIKGATFSVDLTRWERQLIGLMCGGTVMYDSSDPGGWRAPFVEDGQPLPVCIEFWTKAWDGNNQAVTAISSPNASYHHWVLPFVRCSLAEQTFDNTPAVFTVNGVGVQNSVITANGPWNDWPVFVADAGGFTASIGEYDDGTIPEGSCGLQTVPSGS